MSAPSTADVLILGGGHAGLSAALTLYRHRHTCLIFDSAQPRNRWQTSVHATSAWEGRQADELRQQARKELEGTGLVHFVGATIVRVERAGAATAVTTAPGSGSAGGTSFRVTGSDGRTWVGRKLLVALGKEHTFPQIPGYEALYPSGIFHCMFTFGYEQRGKARAGLLAEDALALPRHAAMVVDDTAKFVDRVTVYTNGGLAAGKLQGMREALQVTGAAVDDRPIESLEAAGASPQEEEGRVGSSAVRVNFADGSHQIEDFLVHQPKTTVPRAIVIDQLGLELDERGDIAVRWPFYQTNVPGIFAAGDCASPFKIIPNALLMGANAGAGIARELPRRVTDTPIEWLQPAPEQQAYQYGETAHVAAASTLPVAVAVDS